MYYIFFREKLVYFDKESSNGQSKFFELSTTEIGKIIYNKYIKSNSVYFTRTIKCHFSHF